MRRLAYDPALDGIRAVAVISVMLYHAGAWAAPGGFLGVDVFFVLSGYLITTLLLAEHDDTGHISLRDFWMRRARRLLPALFGMLAWVVVYARWIDPDVQTSGIRDDLLATIFYAANWHDIFANDSYFALFSSPSPLIHTWSLAIEEQWYLIWPVVMLAWARWGRNRMVLGAGIIAGAAVASALAMAALTDPADPSRAYYGTDTRAQALLIGAMLAFLLADRDAPTSRRWQVPVITPRTGWLSLGAVASFILFVADDMIWMYRGGFALVAVASAGVIAAVRSHPGSTLHRALSLPPLPQIGRISYGLYLWHWPVYVLLTPGRTGIDGTALLALRLLATFVVAVASFVVVERPAYRIPTSLPATGVLTAGLLTLGAIVLVAVPSPPSDVPTSTRLTAPASNADASDDTAAVSTPMPGDDAAPPAPAGPPGRSEPTAIAVPTPARPPSAETPPAHNLVPGDRPVRAVVVGDSVYLDLLLGFDRASHPDDIVITGFGLIGCGSIRDDRRTDRCAGRLESWRTTVEADRPDLAVIALSKWDNFDVVQDNRLVEYGSEDYDDLLTAAWLESVDVMSSTGARVVMLGLHCMQGNDDILGAAASIRTNSERTADQNRRAEQFVEDHSENGSIVWLDIRERTCPDGVYQGELDGVVLHRDGIHYTPEGVDLIWDWLVPELIRIGRDGR